ncbi:MAG: hypothetical protein HOP29_19585 [Phycisphaerales bacterium]|nr:hypothetical protein [Phycisphaerales bacterium]
MIGLSVGPTRSVFRRQVNPRQRPLPRRSARPNRENGRRADRDRRLVQYPMPRIFASLAVGDLIVLSAAAVFGLLVDGERVYPQHFGLALFAALLTVLIHAIVVTYFAAGGRMISQAVFIGGLDREPLARLRAGKTTAIRWVAAGVGGIILVVCVGATAARDGAWAWPHFASALAAIIANAMAFHFQYEAVAGQSRLMDEVFREYQRHRSATGNA